MRNLVRVSSVWARSPIGGLLITLAWLVWLGCLMVLNTSEPSGDNSPSRSKDAPSACCQWHQMSDPPRQQGAARIVALASPRQWELP